MAVLTVIEIMRFYTGNQDLQEIYAYMSIRVLVCVCLQPVA